MAIAQFNPLSQPLRGKVGGLVFKHYANKVVVTRAPTFTGQWSTAQQDGRKRFAQASAYARTVCADPVLRAKYEKLAVQRGITIRSAAISAYLQGKTAEIELPPPRAQREPLRRAKPRRGTLPLKSRGRSRTSPPRQRSLPALRNIRLRITAKGRDGRDGRRRTLFRPNEDEVSDGPKRKYRLRPQPQPDSFSGLRPPAVRCL